MGCVILTTLLGSVLSCLHCFRWPDTILGCRGSRVTGHCLWLLGVVRPKNHRFLSQEHRQEQGVRLGDLWKKVSAPAALCRGRCERRLMGRTQHRPLRSANEGLCLQSRALGYQHMSPGGGRMEWVPCCSSVGASSRPCLPICSSCIALGGWQAGRTQAFHKQG